MLPKFASCFATPGSRGLLRNCENFADGSFAALITSRSPGTGWTTRGLGGVQSVLWRGAAQVRQPAAKLRLHLRSFDSADTNTGPDNVNQFVSLQQFSSVGWVWEMSFWFPCNNWLSLQNCSRRNGRSIVSVGCVRSDCSHWEPWLMTAAEIAEKRVTGNRPLVLTLYIEMEESYSVFIYSAQCVGAKPNKTNCSY